MQLMPAEGRPKSGQEVQRIAEIMDLKNQQISHMQEYIKSIDLQLEAYKAKEYDTQVMQIKKAQDTELHALSLKNRLDEVVRDKKLIEEDLYASRDKLKEILKEKITIQNELHEIERTSDLRISDLEYQLQTMRSDFELLTEEHSKVRAKLTETELEAQTLEKARDTFK